MKGFFYVSLLLGILKEVTRSSLTQKADSEKEVSTLFDLVQKVFQQMLECMARSFRKQPEEGLQVLEPPQGGTEGLEGQRPPGGAGCVEPGLLTRWGYRVGRGATQTRSGCQVPPSAGAASPLPGVARSGAGGEGGQGLTSGHQSGDSVDVFRSVGQRPESSSAQQDRSRE